MNKPYVKQLDSDGNILNPINGFYPGKLFLGFAKDEKGNDIQSKPLFFPNRAERRFKPKQCNNRKNSCSRGKNSRMYSIQIIPAKTVEIKDDSGIITKKYLNQKVIIHKQTPN